MNRSWSLLGVFALVGCPSPTIGPTPPPTPGARDAVADAVIPTAWGDAGGATTACSVLALLGCPEGANQALCVAGFMAATPVTATNVSCIAWQTTVAGVRSCGTFVTCAEDAGK